MNYYGITLRLLYTVSQKSNPTLSIVTFKRINNNNNNRLCSIRVADLYVSSFHYWLWNADVHKNCLWTTLCLKKGTPMLSIVTLKRI